ncbi:MAG: hypothetical protein HGB12_09600 [Bacteroidetes bacterium]|nr:hypothetical protein [Bacteroidota bacterium]
MIINKLLTKTRKLYLSHRSLITKSIISALMTFNFITLQTFNCSAQGVAINTTGAAADNSAILDVSGTNQGMLIPRMATTNRPASPATGLIIYNTDCNELQYYNGTAWTSVINTSSLIAPTATAGSGATATQITANWTASTGATHYHLDVSTSNSFVYFVTGFNNLDVSNVTSCNITGLTCGTSLYYRVRAENTCSTSGNSNTITYATSSCFTCGISTVNDIDNNTYNTVSIGTQCWLKENIRTTKYPDNTSITKGDVANGDTDWGIDHAWYSCPPNAANNAEDCVAANSLGMMYQWSAAMHGSTTPGAQGICPTGWHVPTDAEWCTMENTVEAGTDASCNTTGWRGSNTGSKIAADLTDQNWNTYSYGIRTGTGFNNTLGLNLGSSGLRGMDGSYGGRGNMAAVWTSAESGANAWRRGLGYSITTIYRGTDGKMAGFPVRCIKDN